MATAIAATLEGIVGLDIGVFDFIARNSSPDLRRQTVRSLSRVRCDSDILKELSQNKDSEAIEEQVSSLFRKGDKESYILLFKNYFDIQHAYTFSGEQLRDMVSALLKYGLLDYSECRKFKDGEVSFSPIRDAIDGCFIHDFLNTCRDPKLTKRLATALSIDGLRRNNSLVIKLYESIGDEESLAECAAQVSLSNTPSIVEKINDPRLKDKAVREAIARNKSDVHALDAALNLVHIKGYSSFVDYALKKGYAKEIEELADAVIKQGVEWQRDRVVEVVRVYNALKEHHTSNKESERLDRKLERLALRCVSAGRYESFEVVASGPTYTEDFKRKVLKRTDRLLKGSVKSGRVKLERGTIAGFKGIDHFYWCAGHGYEKSDRRAGDICFELGRYDLALAFYKKIKNSGQLLFDTALEIAKREDTAKAFEIFEQIDLNDPNGDRVDTNKEDFYKIIGSAILSLFIKGSGADPSEVKDVFNKKIKHGLIQSISVSGNEENLELMVDFGKRQIRYAQQRVSTEDNRNDDRVLTKDSVSKSTSFLKFYRDSKSAEAEAHWLTRLEGKPYIKKLISSGGFGYLSFNQVEMFWGKTLVGADYNTLKDFLAVAFDLYNSINPGQDPHAEHISKEYIEKRAKEFSVDTDWIHHVLTSNELGIIHNDFAPRNLMTKGNELIVVDHEVYVYGHPVGMAITLVKNPENDISLEQANELIASARGVYPASDEYVKAMNVLWDCRQTRWCKEGTEKHDWYMKDMQEVMK